MALNRVLYVSHVKTLTHSLSEGSQQGPRSAQSSLAGLRNSWHPCSSTPYSTDGACEYGTLTGSAPATNSFSIQLVAECTPRPHSQASGTGLELVQVAPHSGLVLASSCCGEACVCHFCLEIFTTTNHTPCALLLDAESCNCLTHVCRLGVSHDDQAYTKHRS
jgi:hypothetical protein